MRLLVVAALALVLALSTAGNAFASTELAYDNGPPYGDRTSANGGDYLVVWFSLPPGWSAARLVEVRAYKVQTPDTNVELHVWGADKTTELMAPITWDVATTDSWNSISLNVVISGDFYVALKFLENTDPWIAIGGTAHADRSFRVCHYPCPGIGWFPLKGALAIRAYVGPILPPGAPVGGFMEPVNKLAIVAPWLAVIGLVGCIGTVVVVVAKTWKKPEN